MKGKGKDWVWEGMFWLSRRSNLSRQRDRYARDSHYGMSEDQFIRRAVIAEYRQVNDPPEKAISSLVEGFLKVWNAKPLGDRAAKRWFEKGLLCFTKNHESMKGAKSHVVEELADFAFQPYRRKSKRLSTILGEEHFVAGFTAGWKMTQ